MIIFFDSVHVFCTSVQSRAPALTQPNSMHPFPVLFQLTFSPKTHAFVPNVPVLEVHDKVSLLSKIVHIFKFLLSQAEAQQQQNNTISGNIFDICLFLFSFFF